MIEKYTENIYYMQYKVNKESEIENGKESSRI